MNERTKELAEQAGGYVSLSYEHDGKLILSGDDIEKFAELIVKNVCNIVLHFTDVDEGVAVAKKHFGVEE